MKKLILMTIAAFVLCTGVFSQDVKIEVEINVKQVNSFIEFKIESDRKGEIATGHLRSVGLRRYAFHMGPQSSYRYKNNIWFWWDTLDGIADLTIWVYNIKVFDATCQSRGHGEKHPEKTSTDLRLIKKTGSPRLINDPNYPTTTLQIWFDY